MPTELEARQALRDAIVAATGLADNLVRMAYGTNVRGPDARVYLARISDDGVGRAAAAAGDTTWRQSRRQVVQVTAVGRTAGTALMSAHALFRSGAPLVFSVMDAAAVDVNAIAPIQDLTTEGPQGWEYRASFDVTLGYVWEMVTPGPTAVDEIVVTVEAKEEAVGGPTEIARLSGPP